MKYLMFVGDGMADEAQQALGGKTPLAYLSENGELPGMARLAGGEMIRVRTCPAGLPAGSDVAFLSLLGQTPATCYTGRSPLEAAGEGVSLQAGEVSLRVNLITEKNGCMHSYNGSGIGGPAAQTMVEDLIRDPEFASLMEKVGMRIKATDTFRHVAVLRGGDMPFDLTPAHDITGEVLEKYLPRGQFAKELTDLQNRAHEFLSAHPLNRGRENPANGIWFWGAGSAAKLNDFSLYGKTGAVVTAVPLVRGIARLAGLDAEKIPGATGELETNFTGKVEATLRLLKDHDFVLLHMEAPDDQSHLGSLEGKLEAIRRLDSLLIAPVLKAMDEAGEDFRAMVLPDHYTLLSTKTHDGTPIPCALYDSRMAGEPRPFCEALCENEPVLEEGHKLIERLWA